MQCTEDLMPHRSTNFTQNITCPFCSLLCDDLVIKHDSSDSALDDCNCNLAKDRFTEVLDSTDFGCKVYDRTATYKEAIHEVAKRVYFSDAIVIQGMETDVAGTRAAMEFAERTSAIIAQGVGQHSRQNLLRIQRSGGYLTTIAEIRNRADLIVLFGSGPTSDCPRLLERLGAQVSQNKSAANKQSLIQIDCSTNVAAKGQIEKFSIDCAPEQFGMLTDAIRLRVQNNRYPPTPNFVSIDEIDQLLQLIVKADYPVFIWSESDFDFPLGDLAIDSLNQLIEALNVRQRCAGMVVARSASSVTVDQVATWMFGKPTPLNFRAEIPEYFPESHLIQSFVKRAYFDADLVLWLGGLEHTAQPDTEDMGIIAISRLDLNGSDIFIPIGVPGVHHDSHLYRTDQSVAMYLRAATHSTLPSLAEVLRAIIDEIIECEEEFGESYAKTFF